jgi:hypothetical protein
MMGDIVTFRPDYETPAHLMAEEEIAVVLAARWRCQLKPLPQKNCFDRAAHRGSNKVIALIEIRDRPDKTMQELDAMGGIVLSVNKARDGLGIAELIHVPFFFATRCYGVIWWTKVQRPVARLWDVEVFKGNNNPRDPGDKELVFKIPMKHFKRLYRDRDE